MGAVAKIGQTLSEASDIIWEGWQNRTHSEDILAEKYTDALRDVERVYDPDTGSVYEFEAGWYSQYALNPSKYNKQPATPAGRLLQLLDGPSIRWAQLYLCPLILKTLTLE